MTTKYRITVEVECSIQPTLAKVANEVQLLIEQAARNGNFLVLWPVKVVKAEIVDEPKDKP